MGESLMSHGISSLTFWNLLNYNVPHASFLTLIYWKLRAEFFLQRKIPFKEQSSRKLPENVPKTTQKSNLNVAPRSSSNKPQKEDFIQAISYIYWPSNWKINKKYK